MHGEIDLRRTLGLLRRQLRVILAVFIAVVGVAALGIFTTTPIYTATAQISVDPSSRNALQSDTPIEGTASTNARIDGEVLLAGSDNVLLTVIDRLKLLEDPEFQPTLGFTARVLSFLRLREPTLPTQEGALRQTLDKLSSMVSVQRRGMTFLIAINARSANPEKAARLANAIAQAHIDGQLTAKVQSTLDARNVLLQQVASARTAVVESEGSFDRYIESNLGTIVDQTASPELTRLQNEISDLSAVRQQASVNVSTLQSELAQQDYTALADRLADEAIANLERQRQEILGQLDTSANTPVAVDLRERLASIEADLEGRAQSAISNVQSDLVETQNREAALRQDLRRAVLTSGLSADALTELYDLQQQSELAKQQYDQLIARSQQLQAEATLQLADSRIVSEALRPSRPSWPNTQILLIMAAFGGLALGAIVAFLFEHFVGGITTDSQLADLMRVDRAVTVPRTKLQGKQTSLADVLTTSPLSAYSESIRRVRAYADQAIAARQKPASATSSIVVVTSTVPSEGKTTLSLSLARSYALTGRRTLLIDCDLRRPSIHRQLGVDSSKGLIDVLQADNAMDSLSDAMIHDEGTGLTVLMSSRRSETPTDDLITSRKFTRLIEAAQKTFDIIVLDTPPLGPVVDGLYLARFADCVLYIVHWASTGQSEVRRSFTALQSSLPEGTKVIPVLNQQDKSNSTYYRQYGGYYTE